MGNEARCVLRAGKKRYEGKALLETSELIFRGPEQRVKIAFAEIRALTAKDGQLLVETKDGPLVFDGLGASAEKWREKILHPKTRIEKLGVKTGMRVALQGDVEAGFIAELRERKAEIDGGNPDGGSELIFLFVNDNDGLKHTAKLARKLRGAAGLWVVYPKGKKEITEVGVIDSGRKAGLKDVKVVGFSPTHTALKFVIPVDKR